MENKRVKLNHYTEALLQYWPWDEKHLLYVFDNKLTDLVCIDSKENIIKLRNFLNDNFPLEENGD